MSSCCSQNHSLFSLSKLNDQFRIIFWTVCLLYEPNFPSYMFVNRIYNKMISISLLLSQGSHSVWLKRRSKKTVNKPKAELGLSHTCSNRALNPQQSDGGANSARNKGHTYSKSARNKGHTYSKSTRNKGHTYSKSARNKGHTYLTRGNETFLMLNPAEHEI